MPRGIKHVLKCYNCNKCYSKTSRLSRNQEHRRKALRGGFPSAAFQKAASLTVDRVNHKPSVRFHLELLRATLRQGPRLLFQVNTVGTFSRTGRPACFHKVRMWGKEKNTSEPNVLGPVRPLRRQRFARAETSGPSLVKLSAICAPVIVRLSDTEKP